MKHTLPLLSVSSVLALFALFSCKTTQKSVSSFQFPAFYKEGHRGTRGLMPENTIPAMTKAIEVGANFIEVDIYITKDKQVLIAHDPYVNVNHSLYDDGREIEKTDAKKYVWRQMNYADIRKFDVGSKPYNGWPQQQKIKTYMPLLGELIDSVEAFTKERKLTPVIYNIEVKTSPQYDSLGYNAGPEEMITAVMDVVKSKNIGNRFYIQSFDVRPLQVVHKNYPGVMIGFLTGDAKATLEGNLKQLGFTPDIYSPHYKLVTPDMVKACKEQKMKLVPWTVNTQEEMKALIKLGVDGIITDYPNYFSQL
ncbi:glycerophosphodiester phosphodiesterase family protein [Paraflavitalea sp. CAU 1676]|uniref:glycerophosphodiester phosphodiesterase family protein n=1 Tax=Paraflavitalea sp. CAU 1676 TaxID=3032598 RepID=UPI0023D9FA03|nr:glycerophosphodiester phosphodiesterase family protein [Paraflavitalea sp. CAU 1676]MDF2191940.1 glycerophosphodiester phosphodiesterase family protein [Paraflavitalea sp. CAU 1676]